MGGSAKHSLVVAGAIVTSQKSIVTPAQNVNLMETARLCAKGLVRLALKMFEMQVYQLQVLGIGHEVMRGLRRLSA
jgi:hypothetical protein